MKFNYIDYISNFHSRTWSGIVIHHSATKDGKTNDWQAIRLWHTGKSGSADPKSVNYNPYIEHPMRDIGYHFGIEFNGPDLNVYQGRSLDWDGGHANEQVNGMSLNKFTIGICIVGDFDTIPPGDKHYFVCASLVRELMRHFLIPIDKVYPHSKFANKTCPGKKFDMEMLKKKYVIET